MILNFFERVNNGSNDFIPDRFQSAKIQLYYMKFNQFINKQTKKA